MLAVVLCSARAMAPIGAGPKVSAPPNFVAPEPKPLTMTRPRAQLPGLLTGGMALAIRLATGVFTLGWSPQLLTGVHATHRGTPASLVP